MDTKEKENRDKSFSEEKKPTTLPKGYRPNWLYFLFLFLILFSIFNWTSTKPKEISWLTFEQNMLSTRDVAKIVVINKDLQKFILKKTGLNRQNTKTFRKVYLCQSWVRIMQFKFDLWSVLKVNCKRPNKNFYQRIRLKLPIRIA